MTSKKNNKTSFTLEYDKPTTIDINRPVRFQIDLANGSYIKGIIPPNSNFTVCDKGDIVGFNVYIDDESVKPLSLVEAAEEDQG